MEEMSDTGTLDCQYVGLAYNTENGETHFKA